VGLDLSGNGSSETMYDEGDRNTTTTTDRLLDADTKMVGNNFGQFRAIWLTNFRSFQSALVVVWFTSWHVGGNKSIINIIIPLLFYFHTTPIAIHGHKNGR